MQRRYLFRQAWPTAKTATAAVAEAKAGVGGGSSFDSYQIGVKAAGCENRIAQLPLMYSCHEICPDVRVRVRGTV